MHNPQGQTTSAPVTSAVSGNTNMTKLTGLFKGDVGEAYEIRVTPELATAFSSIAEGSYLKAYINTSKAGKQYISLQVKNLG